MCAPFIRNHQYNLIKKQVVNLRHVVSAVSDPKVVQAARYNAEVVVMKLFPDADDMQKQLLWNISAMQTAEDFQRYIDKLEPLMTTEFPEITDKQIKKLFPKQKKLAIPDLAVDYRYVTYFGWTDRSTNRMFIVYPLDGEMIGIEGKFLPTPQKGVCFICNRHGETALFTAVSKARPAGASPDYYKAIGNYLCLDSGECNKHVTDVAPLETFIRGLIG